MIRKLGKPCGQVTTRRRFLSFYPAFDDAANQAKDSAVVIGEVRRVELGTKARDHELGHRRVTFVPVSRVPHSHDNVFTQSSFGEFNAQPCRATETIGLLSFRRYMRNTRQAIIDKRIIKRIIKRIQTGSTLVHL